MPDAPVHIEKAELQQFLRWLRDIDEAVDFIDKMLRKKPICVWIGAGILEKH
jgi:hypothetical protein